MASPVRQFDRGDVVQITSNWYSDAAATTLHDPTTITFRYLDPAGAETIWIFGVDAEVIKDAVGIYHVDLPVDLEGVWYWRWEAAGVGKAADEGSIQVIDSRFYAT